MKNLQTKVIIIGGYAIVGGYRRQDAGYWIPDAG
jgi:hypothetical protein